MANNTANPNISEIQTKNGSVYDVAAKRFSGNRNIKFEGDVTAQESGWDGSGEMKVTTTISEGAVGESKIDDGAVTNAKVADGAINWDKIASSVKNGTIAGNSNEKLATCAQVKTYVDEAITGHGSYLGQKTVAQVNALTGMNNGDHVSVSDSGSITNPDGSSTSVNAGDNVIYDGTLRKWDCLAGDYKVKQDSKEVSNDSNVKTVDKVIQNENGEVSVTFKEIGKVAAATAADKASKVNIEAKVGTLIPLLAGASSDGVVRQAWASQYHDSANGAIFTVGATDDSTEQAQLRLKKGSYIAALRNQLVTASRNYQLPDKNGTILVNSDVTNSYSDTGTAPVNGRAIAAAFNSNGPGLRNVSISTSQTAKRYIKLLTIEKDLENDNINLTADVIYNDTASAVCGKLEFSFRAETGVSAFKKFSYIFNSSYKGVGFFATATKAASSNLYTVVLYATFDANNSYKGIGLRNVMAQSHNGGLITGLSYDGAGTSTTTTPTGTWTAASNNRINLYSREGEAIGSSSQPVYVNDLGGVTACTTADLKAGKDGDGNTITSTYATKTEVDAKDWSAAEKLTSADDLLAKIRTLNFRGVKYYRWDETSRPANIPNDCPRAICQVYLQYNESATTRATINVYPQDRQDQYFCAIYVRNQNVDSEFSWESVYYNPRKSDDVNNFSNDDYRAYTGKAIADHVASAIGGKADASNVYTKSEVDNKASLKASLLTSSDDLDSLVIDVGVKWFYWEGNSRPSNIPSVSIKCVMEQINRAGTRDVQNVYINSEDYYYSRNRMYSNTWTLWKKVYYVTPEITASDVDALWAE